MGRALMQFMPRGEACSDLDTQPGAKTFGGLEGVVVNVGGGGGVQRGGLAQRQMGGDQYGYVTPTFSGGPHSGDRSKWFQLSILCTTLEIPNVS